MPDAQNGAETGINTAKSFLAKYKKKYILLLLNITIFKDVFMDMDKYFKELKEQHGENEKNDTVSSDAPTHCPMCSRRCELSAPLCGRGVMFAQQNGIETQIRHI